MKKINVAIGQCASLGTPQENAQVIESMFLEAVAQNPNLDLMLFPEYAYFAPSGPEESSQVAIDLEQPHPFIERMRQLAREHRVNLIPGSFVETAKDGRYHNTSVFINREGEIIGKYRKIHLMDAASYQESAYVAPGNELVVVDADFGKVGMMTCYDIRFAEQPIQLCLRGAELLAIPAEFPAGIPLPTRVDDWDLLTRGIALSNLTYVVTANQFGTVHGSHHFGRSGIIDPRGTVVAMARGCREVVYGTVDLEYQKQVQETLATWNNRRPDVYYR